MNLLINLDSLLHGHNFFAHVKEENGIEITENLKDHSKLVIKYFDELIKTKKIDQVIINCIKETKPDLSEEEINIIYKYFVNAIYLHDIGKINPKFQNIKLKNDLKLSDDYYELYKGTEHSLYSAVLFLDNFITEDIDIYHPLFFYLLSFAYVISCHHIGLNEFSKFIHSNSNLQIFFRKLKEFKDSENFKNSEKFKNSDHLYSQISNIEWNTYPLDNFKINPFPFYILQKLLFSVITMCDFCATTEFFSGEKLKINIINNSEFYKDKYRNSEIYKQTMEYKKNPENFKGYPINKLRNEMFLESEENLNTILNSKNENLNKNIFYLEAPTGSGKTNMSINLALNLLDEEINNIFYIFPFNTLVEQTATTLKNIFNEENIVVVNSITPIIEKENTAANISLLNHNILNYPISITSHVNFFNALFGKNREENFPLTKFCNSVIIIDEIQSYRNYIWKEIITLLDYYSKIFNMKIIIMSATLPKLDELLLKTNKIFSNLISDPKKYYNDPLFKNRVEINTSLLLDDEKKLKKIDFEELADKIFKAGQNGGKYKKVLVEFISKKNARDFFNLMTKKLEEKNLIDKFYLEEISGDDNKQFRKNIIAKINSMNEINYSEKKGLILITTQVIEAGVDIDMDIGFKDISLIDSEEQFLGRINRSCLKENSVAYFFNYFENIGLIYKGDFRIDFGILGSDKEDNFLELFKEKDFNKIYEKIFDEINWYKNKSSNISGFKSFENLFFDLNFETISYEMKLINTDNYQIFLNHTIKLKDDTEINGKEIWEQYKNLLTNYTMNYSKRKIELSKLAENMNLFTYNIFKNKISDLYFKNKISIGGFYYIENGNDAIENNKFNSDLLFSEITGSKEDIFG